MDDLDANSDGKNYKLEDSEMWHAMALETCGTFLPSECPLVSHMIMSFQKHHSPAMTTIIEDEVLDEAIKVLRPLNEVKMDQINYHQIIRQFISPETRAEQREFETESNRIQGKKGYIDHTGRSAAGASTLKLSAKGKPTGSLLRGGIPSGPGGLAHRKSTKQTSKFDQAQRQSTKQRPLAAKIDTNNDLFYSMDELADMLGLSQPNSSSAAKLAETFSEAAYPQHFTESMQKTSAWQPPIQAQAFSPNTPKQIHSSSLKVPNNVQRKSMPSAASEQAIN